MVPTLLDLSGLQIRMQLFMTTRASRLAAISNFMPVAERPLTFKAHARRAQRQAQCPRQDAIGIAALDSFAASPNNVGKAFLKDSK